MGVNFYFNKFRSKYGIPSNQNSTEFRILQNTKYSTNYGKISPKYRILVKLYSAGLSRKKVLYVELFCSDFRGKRISVDTNSTEYFCQYTELGRPEFRGIYNSVHIPGNSELNPSEFQQKASTYLWNSKWNISLPKSYHFCLAMIFLNLCATYLIWSY